MELQYVEGHTIFECIVGSMAYGTNSPESDIDKSGVMIPGKEYHYGLKRFDQFQGYPGEDKTIYNFQKAIKLITENNPNMLDLLCIPDRCVLRITPYWQEVMDNAELFISKKCKFTFSGYSISQLNRIRAHRAYLLNPPKGEPERSDYGLTETPIFETAQLKALVKVASLFDYVEEEHKELFVNQLDTIYADHVIPLFSKYLKQDRRTVALEFLQTALHNQLNTLVTLGKNSYVKDEYVEAAERELQFVNASRDWQRYQEWKKSRNKKRAGLEEKYGYDCKHAMHLIRLLRCGKEVLLTGKVNVDRTNIDAAELKEIRDGAWPYEQVEEYATRMDAELNSLYEQSPLQKSPQMEKIDAMCVNIIDRYLSHTQRRDQELFKNHMRAGGIE
jgi:predicted nucleotidyltransferase